MENAELLEMVAGNQSPDYLMDVLEYVGSWFLKAGFRVLIAGVLIVIGLKLIKVLRRGVGRSMERAGMEITLRKFLDALLYAVLLGMLVFMAAEELGIKSTSLVTLIGAVTLAMSLSMQNTLANFAGGVSILMLKPFKVGDYVSTADGDGYVDSIGLVYTTLMTMENIKIVIPNNNLANSALTNTMGMEKKRLILPVRIGYSSDLKKAKEVLEELLNDHPAVIKEDGILVIVDSLGDSGVNLSARAWTKTEDYWQTKWDLLEAIKLRFDAEGIEIPYQKLDVQMITRQ